MGQKKLHESAQIQSESPALDFDEMALPRAVGSIFIGVDKDVINSTLPSQKRTILIVFISA